MTVNCIVSDDVMSHRTSEDVMSHRTWEKLLPELLECTLERLRRLRVQGNLMGVILCYRNGFVGWR